MLKNLEKMAEAIEKKLATHAANETSQKIQSALESQLESMAKMPLLAQELFGTKKFSPEEINHPLLEKEGYCYLEELKKELPAIFGLEVRNGIKYVVGITPTTKMSNISWVVAHGYCVTANYCPERYWLKSWDADNSALMDAMENILGGIDKAADSMLLCQKQRMFTD